MKKFISVILCMLMLFSPVSVGASAEENNDLTITVANDLHYSKKSEALTPGKYTGENYGQFSGTSGQLAIESKLIIDELLRQTAASGSEALLLPGDLVDLGSEAEHLVMVQLLNEFEQSSGKSVYVVPGNHDYYGNVDMNEFTVLYNNFGYGEAIARDTLSASYVAELNDEYRLLAIDSCKPGDGAFGINAARVEWIRQQAEKAQSEGKKLIAMMHHNLLEHFTLGSLIHSGAIVDEDLGLPEIFAQYGVKYNFAGHTHDQDIVSYTGSNGETVYDIVTSSVNLYPCPYRVVTFSDKVKIKTDLIKSIDTTTLQGVITDHDIELINSDFTEYAKISVWSNLEKLMLTYISSAQIKTLLKLDETADAEMCAIFDKIMPLLREAVLMPFNKENETEEGKSIESIVAKYDLPVSKTEYKNFLDVVITAYQAHVVGDENFGVLSDEFNLVTTGLTGSLNYVLSEVTGEEYAQVLSFVTSLLGVQISVDFFKYAGTGISRAKGIDIFVTSVISPLLLDFMTDKAPGDNNATLLGYTKAAAEDKEESFFDKIINFFKQIFSFIMRIFGIG